MLLFWGFPGNLSITRFGDSLGPAPLPALTDYADRFLDFLKSEQELIPGDIEKQYFTSLISAYYLSFQADLPAELHGDYPAPGCDFRRSGR